MCILRYMHNVPTNKDSSRKRHTWRERAFVFAGIAAAGAVSAVDARVGAGEEILAPVWLGALTWTVLASLALALWQGFRHGDWSAFRGYELPGVDHDAGDFAYRQLTDPFWRHLPGNIYHSSLDDSTRQFTDPAYASLPGNIHYHSFPD